MKNLFLIKKSLIIICCLVFSALILFSSLRGIPGNPDENTLNSSLWAGDGPVPFGSSNDQGRFSLTYAFHENNSVQFSPSLAQFSAPDLGINKKGEFVSLFAPGVSFLIMPGYIIGKYFNFSQVGSFSVVAIFALMNALLIYAIGKRLGAQSVAAMLGAIAFLFATPAYAYAVSLSQHHFSVFMLLFSLYLLIRWDNWWSLSLVWLFCASSIVIDNPNMFLMFPIGIYALGKIIFLNPDKNAMQINIKPFYILTFITMLFPLVFFGWFNQVSNGSPFKLSGTLERVISIKPELGESLIGGDVPASTVVTEGESAQDKNAVSFFKTRDLLTGFYVHFISRDRGMIWYAPVVLLGIFGLILLFKKMSIVGSVIIASIGINILVYSMWGDPWGGWSFGSRYLIPTYALLSIGLGITLTNWRKNILFLILFFLVFSYSVSINALGALGTSSIPAQFEIADLEKKTGKVQKSDFERSRDFLFEEGSRSFFYGTIAHKVMTGPQYYILISSLIIGMGGGMLATLWLTNRKEKI